MIYAVRLKSKTEGEDGRRENNNPYLIVEGGKIKYIDHIYGNKSEFNFNDEVHTVAKEIFISGLKNAIKEEILLRSILFDTVICRIRKIKISHF